MNWNIKYHLSQFPHAAIQEKEGRLSGTWMVGNNYKRKHGFHGEFPPSFLDRVFTLFPQHKGKVLHLFSGSVEDDGFCRVDINPTLKPTIMANAQSLEWDDFLGLPSNQRPPFKLVIADPPYNTQNAKIYGTKMPITWKVFRALAPLVEPGGMVVWLSTSRPMTSSQQWKLSGLIAFDCGSNRALRGVFIYMRKS